MKLSGRSTSLGGFGLQRQRQLCVGSGRMVRELRELGFVVRGTDLYASSDPLVPDRKSGADVVDLKSLAGYRFIITNLPTANKPPSSPISCRSRPAMESAWRLCHDNGSAPRFAG